MRAILCVLIAIASSLAFGASFKPQTHDPRPAAFPFSNADAEAMIAAAGYAKAGKQFCPHNGLYESNFVNAASSSFDEADCVSLTFFTSEPLDKATDEATRIAGAFKGGPAIRDAIAGLLKGNPERDSVLADGFHISIVANGKPDLRTSTIVIKPEPKREWTGKKGPFMATYLKHDDKTLWIVDQNGKQWPTARTSLAPADQKWLAVWEATSVY